MINNTNDKSLDMLVFLESVISWDSKILKENYSDTEIQQLVSRARTKGYITADGVTEKGMKAVYRMRLKELAS